MKKFITLLIILLLASTFSSSAKDKKAASDSLKNVDLSGLKFRGIGPAITGGRIVAIAVNPKNHSEYYVAAGHGSLWKTTNNGITFTPVFDHENSYAIGSVAVDPSNPNIVWVGTGENNNQNNVIYGDGIYKSEDGGKSWKNMGLKNSAHIGGIIVDPQNSNIVYAAAYGSLRYKGGDRGVFKTTDGGKTWKNVLHISDYTGVYEIHMDPRYSNILYAVAHQRMRKLYTGVYGGPESGIYRSLDSGKTWEKMKSGLPSEAVGRIGLAISPANPDVLYAIVEATKKDKGVYKSVDRGVSWTKQSSYISSYPFYFQKLFCDPADVNTVYSMDVFLQVSKDGGKTWKNLGEKHKHVDNHYLWIDPDNNKHMLAGCDGGLYETYDQGKNWDFKNNIPIAEIYKVTVDNSQPFYYVYAGTQDNNSFGGPSRTISSGGITNQDWFFTWSGDGFETQVDWKNPEIIFAQSQYGGLARFNRKTMEKFYIRPIDFGEYGYRFDWDSPLLISQFDNKRLYFGANVLLRTDDQGNSWEEISPDLTRGVPKEMQKLMGRSWSIDELVRKGSMAQLSTIAESPLDENVLYTGSGDGLIHYTKDGGKTWKKARKIPGLPKYARIHQIIASRFDKQTAYAACHNFVGGDYKPYLYKTTNGGRTWFSINGNLPEKGSTYTIAEDHEKPDLLFVGTQFGVYFTVDGGKEWIKLKNGIPNASVMDLEIQRRENDLVVSTFGRGIYILDDYSPLRYLSEDLLKKDAFIFPVKDALMFIESTPFGFGGTGFMGASFFSAPNPKVGAVFTYYLKDELKTLKEKRREKEKEKQKKGEDIKYPSYDELKKEMEEPEPFVLFTVSDSEGNTIRKLKTKAQKGINRIVWDFRYDKFTPVELNEKKSDVPWDEPDQGYMVVPGSYFVSMSKFENGKFTELVPPQKFVCKLLYEDKLSKKDKTELKNFNRKVAKLTVSVTGADEYRKELERKISYLKKAVLVAADVPVVTLNDLIKVELKLKELNRKLNGDNLRRRYEGAVPTSVKQRVEIITSALWSTTEKPTYMLKKSYKTANDKLGEILSSLKSVDAEIKNMESLLNKYNAPYTPGRILEWERN